MITLISGIEVFIVKGRAVGLVGVIGRAMGLVGDIVGAVGVVGVVGRAVGVVGVVAGVGVVGGQANQEACRLVMMIMLLKIKRDHRSQVNKERIIFALSLSLSLSKNVCNV